MPRSTTLIVTSTNAAQLATSTAGAMALAGFGSLKIAPPNLLQHTLSAAFPRPNDVEFQNLKDSITNIGVQIPITIHDGQVIDGWSRYCAATELGMDCPMVELDDTDPRDFAKSQAARRNLTPSQTAMVIVEIYKWKPAHRPVKTALKAEISPKEIADTNGIGLRTIERARTVHAHAVPEVVAAVKNGDVGLPKAAAIAKLPKAEQAAAIHKPLPKSQPAKREKVEDIAVREVPTSQEPECGPDTDELAAQEAAEQADRIVMQKLLDSDDALATSFAEVKRLNAEVSILTLARDGAMRRANEATLLVKKRDRYIAKLLKELAALQREAT